MSCGDFVDVQTRSRAFSAAQNIAVRLGKKNVLVDAGQVQAELKKLGYTSSDLGNAAGSLFSKKLFRATGVKVKNTNPTANRRKVTQWEYIGEGTKPTVTIGLGSHEEKVPVAKYVDATSQNARVGVSIRVRPELAGKLLQGKRPETAKILEITESTRWPVRVEFTNGQRGLLAYQEFQVQQ